VKVSVKTVATLESYFPDNILKFDKQWNSQQGLYNGWVHVSIRKRL